ncbi:MAG TPA: nuclear transport factor 2 family protein [Chthonomonadales bacterium]|nr:nuclear transport factor 2 family protein [Chthonomonadales bacterium]
MRVTVALVSLCVACSAAAQTRQKPVSHAPDNNTGIRIAFFRLGSAVQKKDLAAVQKVEAPGFLWIQDGRKLNAAAFKAMLKHEFAAQGKIHYLRVNARTLSVKGDVGVITGDYYYRAELRAKSPTSGKPEALDVLSAIRAELIGSGNAWKIKEVDLKTIRTAIDGKPVAAMP